MSARATITVVAMLGALLAGIVTTACPSTSTLVAGDAGVTPSSSDDASASNETGAPSGPCTINCDPVAIVTDVQIGHPFVVDRGYVYWLANKVERCPVTGCGGAKEVVVAAKTAVHYFAIGDAIYAAEFEYTVAGERAVTLTRTDRDTRARSTLLSFTSTEPSDLAVTSTRLLYSGSSFTLDGGSGTPGLYECPVGGAPCTSPKTYLEGSDSPGWALVVSEGGVVWISYDYMVHALDFQSNKRLEVDVKAATFSSISGYFAYAPLAIAPAGSTAVWVAERSAAKDDQAIVVASFPTLSERQLVGGLNTVGGVAIDAEYAYFTTGGTGEVKRIKIDGSMPAPETIATGQATPAFMAVDNEAIYWFNVDAHTIMRRRK